MELGCKALMWIFIKRLAEVQQYGIDLLASVLSCGQIMHCKQQIAFPESVLMVTLVAFQEVHKVAVDYICSMILLQVDVKDTGL